MKLTEFSLMQLDFAVLKAQGGKLDSWDQAMACVFKDGSGMLFNEPWMDGDTFYSPTQNKEQAAVIIKEEEITLTKLNDLFSATSRDGKVTQVGETLELAAMRCYVETQFGNDFDPEAQDEDFMEYPEPAVKSNKP